MLVLFLSCCSLLHSFHHHRTSTHSLPALQSKVKIISETDYEITSIGMPTVIPPKKSTEKWLLWFHSRDKSLPENLVKGSSGRIYHADSEDGIIFTMHPSSPVLGPAKEQGDWFYFDSEHVGLGDVLVPGKMAQSLIAIQEGVFFMYTFGGNADAVKVDDQHIIGSKMEIGVAISQDGAHWSRVEGDSAYGSILEKGSVDEFDALFCGWPCIVEDGREFKMYYHTYDPRTKKFTVGLAISQNGVQWKKKGAVFAGGGEGSFDEMGVTRRQVVKVKEGVFRMWYEGISKSGVHSIGLATSSDGVRWERVADEPIFARNPDESAFDSGGVGSPRLVYLEDKQRWRMYYIGVPLGSSDSFDGNADAEIGIVESTDDIGMYFER